MYFLYLLLLCYTSILLTPASTYVVLTANLHDFRSLAKKYVPKNLAGQIKAIVLENGHRYYKEPLQDDGLVDGTVEYLEDNQEDDSYVVTREFTTNQQPKNRYQSKKGPKVAFTEMSSPIAPTVLTIDDLVEKVKQRLFQEILDRSVNAQANSQAGDSLAYKNFPKKSIKVSEAKVQVANPVYKSVPMKVIKEEVQFEATYDDLLDKDLDPQIQYSGQYLQSNPLSPKKNFVNTQYHGGGVKKVRFVKQLLVPANSNQGQSAYVPQPSMALQPMQQVSLGQQPSIVPHSNLEPQLSLMQQPSMVQKPLYTQLDQQTNAHQSTIMKQLILLQQQIEQLNRTAQQKVLKNKQPKSLPALGVPQLTIGAVEANFEIVPNSAADDKTNDGKEDQAELSKVEVDESVLSDETTEPSTKALTVPGTVENEQFTEENEVALDSARTNEKDEEKSPAETKESVSNEELDTKKDPEIVKGNDTTLGANAKVYTQEFGNPDAGEPIVTKTYNFNEPNVEAGKKPVNLKLPVDSARKVMLF